MIGQYLPNNNETATVAFRQKFCQLNSPLACGPTQTTSSLLPNQLDPSMTSKKKSSIN
jgi:hypothetical protein